MTDLRAAKDAIRTEIKSLLDQQARLTLILDQLNSLGGVESAAVSPAHKPTAKRLRLKNDVAADIESKIVKAVIAHKTGASRKDIVTYLGRNGWHENHHYNPPHLTKLVNKLISGDTPALRRAGEKANARYHVA